MTKEEFLKLYCFTFQIVKQDNTSLVVITGIIERNSQKIVDNISTIIDVPSTSNWNKDSESEKSIPEWNWDTYIDQVKRFQLDYFAKRISIEKYFPLNAKDNAEIGEMYK